NNPSPFGWEVARRAGGVMTPSSPQDGGTSPDEWGRGVRGAAVMQAEQTSFLFGANAAVIADLYARFLEDPGKVDADWRTFFEALAEERGDVLAEVRGASWAPNRAPVIDVA